MIRSFGCPRGIVFLPAALLVAFLASPGRIQAAPPPDTDGDGVPDSIDVCPSVSDPGQENSDPLSTNSASQRFARFFCPNNRLGTNACPSTSPIYTGRGPFAVAAADFDEDGWSDVAVATRVDGRVWVHFNNRNLKDSIKIRPTAPIFRGTMGREDFNGNGLLDLGVCQGSQTPCINDKECGGTLGTCVGTEDLPTCAGTANLCSSDSQCGGNAGSCSANGILDVDDRENLGCRDTDSRTPCLVQFLATPGDLRGIVAADFNGDQHADIATLSFVSSTVLVFLGKGDGTFGTAHSYAAGASPRELLGADFNGDGKLDLAVPNFSANKATILLANADGSFRTAPDVRAGPGPISVAAADFDHDGKIDLAVLNFGLIDTPEMQSISIALGNGDGTFRVQPVTAPAASEPFHIAAGQANGRIDSFPDLLSVSVNQNQALLVFGQGNGTFHAPGLGFLTQGAAGTSSPGPRFGAIADLTTDHLAELMVANYRQGDVAFWVGGGTLSITASRLEEDDGNGPGFFPALNYSTLAQPQAGSPPPNGPRGFVLVDLDRSRTPDVVIGNLDADSLNVFTSAGDGFGDACDNCTLVSNEDQVNTDGDALGDACDPDDDNDQIPDTAEPTICNQNNASQCLNPLNPDFDNDFSKDGAEILFFNTDPFNPDTDGDTILDGLDLCPTIPGANDRKPDTVCVPGQQPSDTDCDGLGNSCDLDDDNDNIPDTAEAGLGLNPLDPDFDLDGVLDGFDNCPRTANPDQKDTDGDELGDLCDDDIDNDGLSNAQEASLGTRPDLQDTDGDGLTDFEEVNLLPQPTKPLIFDSDGDGANDGREVNVLGTDPLTNDTDGDRVLDGADNCPLVRNGNCTDDPLACDGNGDQLVDPMEVRVGFQHDIDADGQGDACDEDIDGDGLANVVETNVEIACLSPGVCLDPFNPDFDNDGLLDGRDFFLGTAFLGDADGDGIADGSDNCPQDPNPDQADSERAAGADGLCAQTAGGIDGSCVTLGDNNPALYGPDLQCGTVDDLPPTPEGIDGLCADTAGGVDGRCGTPDDDPALFGSDQICGTPDDLLPIAAGADLVCGTADDNRGFYGPDGACGTVDDIWPAPAGPDALCAETAGGLDGKCNTAAGNHLSLFGPDTRCGTADDIKASAAGLDGLCAETAGGLDGRCDTPDDNHLELFGSDGECGTLDDLAALASGLDGICGNGDDNLTLYGSDGLCGTSDDLPRGDSVNLDNNLLLFGPDGRCGTADDLKVGDSVNLDNNLTLVGSDGRCGSRDDQILGNGINLDNNLSLLGPDGRCNTVDDVWPRSPGRDGRCAETAGGLDGRCSTAADNHPALFGSDAECGTSDDLKAVAAGLDGLCALTAGGLDGNCSTVGNVDALFGKDNLCGTDDDLNATAAGVDKACGTGDDNVTLYGADHLCGTSDDLSVRDSVNLDNNLNLLGPDGRCGTSDDLSVGDSVNLDNNLSLVGPDQRCGTIDDQVLDDDINPDNNPLLFGPDQRCGSSDDLRGDGLGDACEGAQGTDPTRPDSDGDGLFDGAEVFRLGEFVPGLGIVPLIPNSTDSDNDGLSDAEELLGPTNVSDQDTDGDGFADGQPSRIGGPADNCPIVRNGDCAADPLACDANGDGFMDSTEERNGFQRDLDGDHAGDACDDDIDGDGLSNDFEVKIARLNPRNADTDGDGASDFVEVRIFGSNPRVADTDFDGRLDGSDNCPVNVNPLQNDVDHDGVGDTCDCAPFDGATRSAPDEARLVRAALPTTAEGLGERMRLSWLAPNGVSAASLLYAVARGQISDLRATRSFSEATCLARDLSGTALTDSVTPEPGQAFYYLIQAENTCGGGSFGLKSDGTQRLVEACSQP